MSVRDELVIVGTDDGTNFWTIGGGEWTNKQAGSFCVGPYAGSIHLGEIKLFKCLGTQNVADSLTKSLPRPAFAKHREYMWGTRVPFSAFYSHSRLSPCAAYVVRFP